MKRHSWSRSRLLAQSVMLQGEASEEAEKNVICWKRTAYQEASLEQIVSEEGKPMRVNRSIQMAGVFGELKYD